jgi:acetyl-CoA C-acetyltransferase
MHPDPVVITGFARTPIGGLRGVFADLSANELGAAAAREAVARAGAPAIDQINMGCVLAAGQGQAPARQAGIRAGLGEHVPAVTVNKMCGSGMVTVMQVCDMLQAGSADCAVAGGMESMTNAPYLLARHRGGARFGHDKVFDSMLLDGLEDAYERGKPMGVFAEEAAQSYQIGRGAQDEYAQRSLERGK